MHGATVDAAGGAATAAALRRFAATLRRRHARGAFASAALRSLLALAAPAVLLSWLVPSVRLEVVCVVVAVVAATALPAGLGAFWRGRGALAALGRDTQDSDLGLVRDELITWFEQIDRGAQGGMLPWLEADVSARLMPRAEAALRAASRPHVGRWQWLLPLALVLLLAWLVAEWLAPPWRGMLGGAASAPTSGGGGGAGDGDGEGGGEGESEPDRPEPEARAAPVPDVPPPPPPSESEPPPPAEGEPPPLLDLPEQQRFVVPDFVGDGPTRRARMHAAEVDDGPGGQLPPRAAGGTEDPSPQPPPEQDERFDRAAEQALRSRHVPPAERPMVRRFFERLREAGG